MNSLYPDPQQGATPPQWRARHRSEGAPRDISRPSASTVGPWDVAILLFDGFSLMEAGTVVELFRVANRMARAENGAEPYRVRLAAVDGATIASSSSLRVSLERFDLGGLTDLHALFVIGESPRAHARLAPHEARMLGLLQGVFGHTTRHVLPLQRATAEGDSTHDRLLGSVLAQIAWDLGEARACSVADQALPGGARLHRAFIADACDSSSAQKMRESARWLLSHCEEPITVADAARAAVMSERNFLRCFKREMQMTPSDFLRRVRIEMTCRLLSETDLPIDKIARRCGMRNGDKLAKLFRRSFAVSPSEFRARLRGPAR
jgi:transcriptional regulator GlxA family with amidase domain